MLESESRCEATANSSSSDVDKLKNKKDNLEWVARYNVLLNEDMERHYGFCDAMCKIAVAMFGTYAFASLFIGKSIAYSVCGVVVTALSILTLVVDFKEKQVRAKSQRNRYCSALASVESVKDESDCKALNELLFEIGKDDLPSGTICDALAVNAAIDQMGRDVTYKADVGTFRRITRYIIPWGAPKYGHR
jgi:hypothetical protein